MIQEQERFDSFLCTSESTFSVVFDFCEFGLIVLNAEGRVVNWNSWIERSSNISRNQAQGKTLESIFPSIANSSLLRALEIALSAKMSSFISHSLNRSPLPLTDFQDKKILHNIVVKPIHSHGLEDLCLIQITDISAAVKREHQLLEQANKRKDLTDKLRQEKERAQVTLRSIADAVITTDTKGFVVSMNQVAEEMTGWQLDQAIDKPVAQIFSVVQENSREFIPNPVSQCIENRAVVSNDQDLILIDKHGRARAITESAAPILSDNGELIGAILVFSDVTHSRQLAAQLKWQAEHDPLTGLVNRWEFETAVKRFLANAKTVGTSHSLLYIDLDQFKVVNDTCGHTAGDELLRQLSSLLQRKLRSRDILARFGGDEFCVLLEDCNKENGLRIANFLKQEINAFRFVWDDRNFCLGISIGLVEITGTENNAEEILSVADSACYVAKDRGRNRIHVHEPDQEDAPAHQREMQWISRLQSALDEDRFCLFVQRIVSISDSVEQKDHFEVLIRMLDIDGNLIPPGAFIPAAERFNLMPSIDRWVIRKLFDSIRTIALEDQHNLPMFSINLSGASLTDEHLLTEVQGLLSQSPLPANRLCFEITETAAISNLAQAIRFITEIKHLGCYFSLDDFGSGFSSFGYLKNIPVDFLKIDGHFVKDMVDNPINRAFVESINQIGHVMGLTTIAEFVENDAILEMLKEVGVDYAQGYGIDRPKQFSELYSLLGTKASNKS